MNNNKLVNVLRSFSINEMKEFEKFISSPFFNRGRNYLPFLKELKKFYPDFDDDKMTPEYIHSRLYPGKKFNRQMIWNMNSALWNIAEEFLVHLYLKNNNIEKDRHAADELSDRNLPKLYSQKLDKLEDGIKKEGLSILFFEYKTHLEIRRSSLYFNEDQQHNVSLHELKRGEYAILYVITTLANVISNINYNKLLYNINNDINLPYEFINNLQLDKIIEYAKSNQYEYAYLLELYYCEIMLSMNPDETSYFFRFKELFESYSEKFDAGEKTNLLNTLVNYCVYKINGGDINFTSKLFEVNLLQLKEIDKSEKKMGKVFYIQVLRNSLMIDKIDWAKSYIEKYTLYLKRNYQKTMYALAEAFLAHKLKDYHKVIESLSNVKFIDSRDKFYVRSLSLMAYYELGDFPTLVYYIESSKQFVNKNPSLGVITRKNFNYFLVCLNKLFALRERNDLFGLEVLKDEILKDKSVTNRKWLIEKFDEIIQK